MQSFQPKNIRTFIGAKNFAESRAFYQALGFEEVIISEKLSLFKLSEEIGFYLQHYYVRKWVNNSMVFMEVDDIEQCAAELTGKGVQDRFRHVRFTEIKHFDWGRELFMHDPSGVLWHFCEFHQNADTATP